MNAQCGAMPCTDPTKGVPILEGCPAQQGLQYWNVPQHECCALTAQNKAGAEPWDTATAIHCRKSSGGSGVVRGCKLNQHFTKY